MNAFFSRRGGGAASRKMPIPIRVGHVYLDSRGQTLYCLNETARQLLREGVPLNGRIPSSCPLRTLEGTSITAGNLPLDRARREGKSQERVFLFTESDGVTRHLTWHAHPLADAGGVRGVFSSLIVAPFEPDWQHLAGLAHDLRTPLQALRLLMPMLESTELQPEARVLLERIRAGVERTLSISMDLLEWTRSPMQAVRRVQASWFALEPFLVSLAGEQAAHAQRKGIAWYTEVEPVRGLEVYIDRVSLGRLLANLMVNAIRYTTRGEIHVRAGWRGDPAAKDSVLVLSVADTGSGISPQEQDSIFQPFERGSAGKESDSDGSGMGLAVVDRLVEELGLVLEVRSEHGQGSKFEVLLPASSVRAAKA
jgi:signal transduction histidine kinase